MYLVLYETIFRSIIKDSTKGNELKMKKPEIPINETERLKELKSFEIFDTEEQEDFDFLTLIASKICKTPIALISLVDSNRQWFLSKQGLELREISRDVSFCSHTILNPNEIFLIENSNEDERFFDNPLVTGYPKIIFYAGVPLITKNGYPIGTLCVIKDKPSQLTFEQKNILKSLAKQVVILIESKRKSLEQESLQLELKKNLTILEETQKANHIGAWELDIPTGVLTWTEEVYRIHEVSFDFDYNKGNAIEFYHPEDRPLVIKSLTNAIQKNLPFDIKCRFITAKGNAKWVRSTGRKIRTKLIGSFQDITDSKKIESELKQSIHELQEAQHNLKKIKDFLTQTSSVARVGGWEFDIRTQTIEWTDSIKEIHEVPFDYQPTLEGILSFFTLESRDRLQEAVTKAIQNGTGYDLTLQIKTAKGNLIWTRGIGNALFINGECVKLYGTFQDINAQKKIEEELRESLNQVEMFRNIIESSGDCFYMVDLDNSGKMIYANEAAERHFQASKKQIYQWTIPDWDPNFTKDNLAELIRMVEREKRLHLESNHKLQDGSIVPVEITVNYLENSAGQKIAYGWFSNISTRLEVQAELKKAKLEAEAASKAKSEFLANMSHEIRTPLNGVIGFTNLLWETSLTEIQRKHLGIVNSSANSLLAIINDILDFSKIEAGMMNLEIIQTDIHEIFSDSMDIVQYSADKKNIELLYNIDPNLPRFAKLDPMRLKQVLANLLGNAVKFTDSGEVELKVKYRELEKGKGKISISIRDTGIGITEEQKSKLFQSFSQADSSVTRKFGGTGLGLIISQMIANVMGSIIQVESQFGLGSIFSFDLELETEEDEPLDLQLISTFEKCLIIDDNPNNQAILKQNLESWNIESISCSNSIEALQVLKSHPNISLILCDYRMPHMNGLEIIKMIQEKFVFSKENIQFVLLYSSSDEDHFHKQCDELGIKLKILKPVKPLELFASLDIISSKNPAQSKDKKFHPRFIQEVFTSKITIMIADDVSSNLLLIKMVLKKLFPNGIFLEATNGMEVLKLYQEIKPDLIFMDVQMPAMDGLEATKKIRVLEKEIGKNIPIIALTAGALVEEQKKCMEAGMDDFLTKPIQQEKIKSVLQRFSFLDSSAE